VKDNAYDDNVDAQIERAGNGAREDGRALRQHAEGTLDGDSGVGEPKVVGVLLLAQVATGPRDDHVKRGTVRVVTGDPVGLEHFICRDLLAEVAEVEGGGIVCTTRALDAIGQEAPIRVADSLKIQREKAFPVVVVLGFPAAIMNTRFAIPCRRRHRRSHA